MRFLLLLTALLQLAILVTPALAQRDITPALLTPDSSYDDLKPHILFSSGAPMEELESIPPEIMSSLRPIAHASIQFGQVGESVIALIPVRNVSAERGEWILNTRRGSLAEFRLYVDRGAGLEKLIDKEDPQRVRDILYRYHAFATEFALEPGEEATFVIQFQDTSSSYMPLEVVSREDFFTDRRANVAIVSAVVAGSLILIFFNVLMFGITGKREFAWLGAAEVAFTFNTFHAEGYSTIFLLYDSPGWQMYLGDMLRVSFSALMAQFGRVFLDTQYRFPRLDKVLRAAVWTGWTIFAFALFSVWVPILPVGILDLVSWLHTAAVAVILPLLAVLAFRNISTIYWPLILSWTSVGLYIVYMAVAVSGIAPQLPLFWHWVGPIGLFECIMATLALGLHLRRLHFERLVSERTARDALLEKLAISNEAARMAEERARALAAVQSRDRLIESSGHDTRHVLHALNSAIHFARSRNDGDAPTDDLTGLIEASARHLDDIVATSVGVGTKSTPFMALGLVDVNRIFRDIVAIYAAPAYDARARISCAGPGKCTVITDEALVARAVSNLVNNAIKFSEDGEIALACSRGKTSFTITVTDTGNGLPQAVKEELQGEEREREDSVLGTGWRAIREVMALLGGEYDIESSSSGTRITLEIPDPLGDNAPDSVDLAHIQREAPGLAFLDGDAHLHYELEEQVQALPSDVVPVLVTSRSGSDERVWAANHFALMLTRPLTAQVITHRHLRKLHKSPADLARSTS